jgi:Domain of unknown function (DUF6779)
MTDLSRGARARRSGRRPGWILLTALLVLAIGASSALVFTTRVELLKLAVILALWAAVVAAFVSVIYRRQSDVDQARARDLKLVYDLQLDREISARREYELTVESQLRRELASELRAHSADEVSALRAELAALRTNLEILFDAELSERPALETERKTVRSDWDREHESARERVNRVTSVRAEEPPRRADDSSIIDVPEEPLAPPPRQPVADSYQSATSNYQPVGAHDASGPNLAAQAYEAPEPDRGGRRRRDERVAPAQQDESTPPTGWAATPGTSPASDAERQHEGRWTLREPTPAANGWAASAGASSASAGERPEPQPPRRSHRREETPPPEPRFVPPPIPPEPPPQPQRPEWTGPTAAPRHRETATGWQPVASEGQWLPPGAPGSNWNAEPADNTGVGSWKYDNAPSRERDPLGSPSAGEAAGPSAPLDERRARHSSAAEPAGQIGQPEAADWREPGRRAAARHSAENSAYPDTGGIGDTPTPAPAMSPPPTPPPPMAAPPPPPPDTEPAMSPPPPASARHRTTDPLDTSAPPSGGQSVAELLARLQPSPSGGGRRRRRED